jgi:hypothetical protein
MTSVPASAASVVLQLGNVTDPASEYVTVPLNLDGE